MSSFILEEFDHLKIQLEDIMLATNNFGPDNLIGGGGFGPVYKGELYDHSAGRKIMVACKRSDPKFGQGNVEFLKEIVMLSKYKHENLVSLLHFCIEGREMILVYEYASRGSLDKYLGDTGLTWFQRLKICTGVARGLKYLHDPTETRQRVIHRDIKSSNILLDEEWEAKVSDFGLSKVGQTNQPQTYVVSNAVGTPGYCDPLYFETGLLSKESDVYSFGVVLFEVLCGKLCCEYNDHGQFKVLVQMWRKCFDENRLDEIICPGLKGQIESGSLKTYSAIAYQCLRKNYKERPTMAKIVQELEIALEQQELIEDIAKRMIYEEMKKIADLAVPPLSYISQSQLLLLFMKGFNVDDGKTWFSVNKKGNHYELISAAKCTSSICTSISDNSLAVTPTLRSGARFEYVIKYVPTQDLRLRVMTQFLSPHVTYTINLVYKCEVPHYYDLRIPFKYKLEEMTEYFTSCVAHVGEGSWLRTELFQFTSNKKQHYFEIQFLSETKLGALWSIIVEGIEFCPVDSKDEPSLEGGEYKPSISKESANHYMLPARAILQEEKSVWNFLSRRKTWLWKPLSGSRFNEVAECCDINHIAIRCQIDGYLLSPYTLYACYLVYKLPENTSVFEGGIVIGGFRNLWFRNSKKEMITEQYIYLLTPTHTPIIEQFSTEESQPSRTCRKIKGHPKLRKDGWTEMQVWDLLTNNHRGTSWVVEGYLKSLDEWNFTGLLVQGIEFRPAKVPTRISLRLRTMLRQGLESVAELEQLRGLKLFAKRNHGIMYEL